MASSYDVYSQVRIRELEQENRSLLNTIDVLKKRVDIYRDEAKAEATKRGNYEKQYYDMFYELSKLKRELNERKTEN